MLRPPERLPVLVFFDMVGRYLRSLPAVVVPTVPENTDSPVAKSKRPNRPSIRRRRRQKYALLREQQDEVLQDLAPPTE
jgi:hypothetical protein